MKSLTLSKLLFALIAFGVISVSCNRPNPVIDDPEDPEDTTTMVMPKDLEPFKLSVPVTDNWIFSGKPSITIRVENPNDTAVMATAKMKLATDKGEYITTIIDSAIVAAKATQDIIMTTPDNLEPGFYKATCSVNGKFARSSFVFGIDPTKIVSAPDKQADYDEFWEAAKKQLEEVEMNAELTEITSKSSEARKVYLVEMQSVADGTTGEPVTIRGYYVEPQDGQKHPVIMHYFGYDDLYPLGKVFCPSGGSSAEYAEFYLSTRGEHLNNRTADMRVEDGKGDFVNTYGDWFAFHFGDKNSYYYRGAFMDCVQAVRFMATRPTSDMDNLFAEGTSQGSAFTHAAAALSDYTFNAIATGVTFLGDFPDYFDIVSWPASVARENKGSMTNEEMFAFLSYFDTKNLATRITCPVIAYLGLQDGTCPPHTNMAPYNNLPTEDKQMSYYPELKHEVPGGWQNKYMSFFKAHRK